jgi:hypothetical protein
MMKEGKAHLDNGCHFNTSIDIRQSISFIRVALRIFGIYVEADARSGDKRFVYSGVLVPKYDNYSGVLVHWS